MSLKPEVRQWLDKLEIDVAQRKVSASGLYTQMRYAVTSREEKLEDLEGQAEKATEVLREARDRLILTGDAHLVEKIDEILSRKKYQ